MLQIGAVASKRGSSANKFNRSSDSLGDSPKSGEFAHNSFTSLHEDDVGLKREIVGGHWKGLLLGQGSFGAVYEAYNIKNRKTVALKICSSTRKKSLDKMKMHAIDQVEQEVRILSSLPRSPFIVDFIESVTLEAEQSVLVSFALIQGENLHQLVSNQGSLPVTQVRHVMWCLMKAMEHLQQNGIIHGDVKPENVIFSIDKQARLSDFGCACRIEDCTAERFRNLATVSPAFQSPEFANGQTEEGTEEMSIEWQGLEMWALGIFGFFVAVGAYPFSMEDGALTLLDRISNVDFDKGRIGDAELRCLVSSMLALSTQRANLQQSFNHPFLREYTGECPVDCADWRMPEKRRLTFVDGVHPSVYQTEKKASGDGNHSSGSSPTATYATATQSSSSSSSVGSVGSFSSSFSTSRPNSVNVDAEPEASAPISRVNRRSPGCTIL